MRLAENLSNERIANLWNEAAEKRFQDIESGADRSYNEVLLPLFMHEIEKQDSQNILDAGCGVGFITIASSRIARMVIGVDLSERSIDIAREKNSAANVEYFVSSIEKFDASDDFDFVICNMVLMDAVDHIEVLRSIRRVCAKNCTVLATITNPYYWPRYWGYEKKRWFNYNEALPIEARFQTSTTSNENFTTVHSHRPLSSYLSAFSRSGFNLTQLRELTGFISDRSSIHSKYPRYLAFYLRPIDPCLEPA